MFDVPPPLPQRGYAYQPRVATLRRFASLPWVNHPAKPANPERVHHSEAIVSVPIPHSSFCRSKWRLHHSAAEWNLGALLWECLAGDRSRTHTEFLNEPIRFSLAVVVLICEVRLKRDESFF